MRTTLTLLLRYQRLLLSQFIAADKLRSAADDVRLAAGVDAVTLPYVTSRYVTLRYIYMFKVAYVDSCKDHQKCPYMTAEISVFSVHVEILLVMEQLW